MTLTPPLLDIANLGAGYGAAPVLFGVDATIRPGEIVALVGNNGAGKTTLLRAISRVIAARAGWRSMAMTFCRCGPRGSSRGGWSRFPRGASSSGA